MYEVCSWINALWDVNVGDWETEMFSKCTKDSKICTVLRLALRLWWIVNPKFYRKSQPGETMHMKHIESMCIKDIIVHALRTYNSISSI